MTQETLELAHSLARGVRVPVTELWRFPEGLIGLPDALRFALGPVEGAEPFAGADLKSAVKSAKATGDLAARLTEPGPEPAPAKAQAAGLTDPMTLAPRGG